MADRVALDMALSLEKASGAIAGTFGSQKAGDAPGAAWNPVGECRGVPEHTCYLRTEA